MRLSGVESGILEYSLTMKDGETLDSRPSCCNSCPDDYKTAGDLPAPLIDESCGD